MILDRWDDAHRGYRPVGRSGPVHRSPDGTWPGCGRCDSRSTGDFAGGRSRPGSGRQHRRSGRRHLHAGDVLRLPDIARAAPRHRRRRSPDEALAPDGAGAGHPADHGQQGADPVRSSGTGAAPSRSSPRCATCRSGCPWAPGGRPRSASSGGSRWIWATPTSPSAATALCCPPPPGAGRRRRHPVRDGLERAACSANSPGAGVRDAAVAPFPPCGRHRPRLGARPFVALARLGWASSLADRIRGRPGAGTGRRRAGRIPRLDMPGPAHAGPTTPDRLGPGPPIRFDRPGDEDRRPGRAGPDQQGHRRPTVPVRAHRRVPRAQRPGQAAV